jgi:RsiW-degrading membrane proteinase PrsW (M82 family)
VAAKSNRRKTRTASPHADAGESRGVVGLTVAWMLTCMCTAASLAVAAAIRLILLATPAVEPANHPWNVIAGMVLLVAVVSGLMCLGLTSLVLRLRGSPPPRSVTVFAVVVSLAPLVWLVATALIH